MQSLCIDSSHMPASSWASGSRFSPVHLCVEVVECGKVGQQKVVDAERYERESQTTARVLPATTCDHLYTPSQSVHYYTPVYVT